MGVISAEIGPTKLDSGWIAARSTEISLTGVQLTTTNPPGLPTITTTRPQRSPSSSPWMEASVPGTVLGTLLKNKLIPDPFYGLDNEAIIDIADSGREYYTFWFFKTFECNLSHNQYLDLKFRAINYSAEVFLNGHKKTLPKGMFRRHSFDVTDILQPDGKNLLAVLVHPPDHPGRIPSEGGQGGDHEIGKDVAAQYVEGWDWIIPIRDRNTGIWDEVSIYITGVNFHYNGIRIYNVEDTLGAPQTLLSLDKYNNCDIDKPVKIIDPHLVSSFFDDFKRAYLHTSVKLENKSSWLAECTLNIKVSSEVEGNFCLIEHLLTQELKIPPTSHVQHTFPPLFFYKPDLWWPNGMGKQSMYHVEITVDVKGHGESDTWTHQFGFRKIESTIDTITGGRLFKVNGQPIFIRGGNWTLSDGLLRLSKERYRTDIKFHADMNLNMIRCWGGGLAERPEFYHYCDIYGLLVWQEFWITGDVDGRGIPISNLNGPLDHDLFMLCARDTVKLLRNHASLAIWVGGNEQVPPDDINTDLKKELRLHSFFQNSFSTTTTEQISLTEDSMDPNEYLDGTRSYIQGSLWDGFANGKGDFTDGPYEIQNPSDFFRDDYYGYGFNPEIGSVGMPVADTIRATMPTEGWEIPLLKQQSDGYIEEIPNPIWVYHKYIPYSKPGNVHDQIVMYGSPTDLDDFCEKAQLVNYMQYRAIIEAWTSRMWTKYTGVLIWKMQNPWTGLRGQLYDHLLDQNGGFYGCRSAAEPIHVQLNLASYFIEVVNTTSVELFDLAVEISVWDLDGNCPFYKVTEKITAPPKKVLTLLKMKYPQSKNPKPVYFLLLKLFSNSANDVLSRNFYWLHQPGGDYKLLEHYRKKKVPLKVTSDVMITGSSYKIQLLVENISKINNDVNVMNNDFIRNDKDDYNLADQQFIPAKAEVGLLRRICTSFSGNNRRKVVKMNDGGESETGVAFFLRFSVHAAKKKYEENPQDTRILPVHYTDNYISLVPGESMKIGILFDAPQGITPRIALHGWNYKSDHFAL